MSSPSESAVEVEVQIRGLMMDPVTNMPIVLLKDVSGDAVLPIWVGMYEANAIALELEKTLTPRPMTHDLLRNVMLGLHAEVSRVVVNALLEDTYHAIIWMTQDNQTVAIDSRPSDALAMALRWDCPIYVTREVLDRARNNAGNAQGASLEQMRQWLENLNDDDMGRYKM